MKHRARKRFGQNFLTDQAVVGAIVDAIAPERGQLIVEIGPGQAALTRPLAASGAELHLVEIDRDLAARLEQELRDQENVHLHCADALKLDFGELTGHRRFRLVGNLPYNISTPLLFHVLQWSGHIQDMYFMLQQEVVDRMAAQPGSKAWGRLSVMCQYHCSVTRLFDVPPTAFTPAPRVQSAIVRLAPRIEPPADVGNKAAFDRLVSRAFAMRRKTLRNNLKGLLASTEIESLGIDPGRRPETLSLEELAALSRLIQDRDKSAGIS